MLRTLTLSAALTLGLSGVALAAGDAHVEDFDFSFEGPFGSYDTMQLQRGLQVYTEICSTCHGLQYVAFRTLAEEGGPALPEEQMRAYAAQFVLNDYDSNPQLVDPETGDQRVFTPADRFPANHMVLAPDLSLMAKARAGFHGPYGTGLNQLFKGMGGAEYIASLLTGYADEPECALEGEPMDGYYNTAFANGGFPESCVDEDGKHMVPGSYIGMAPPLYGDDVVYADGHSTELEHIAEDVSAFLMWTAEPKLVARKQAGLTGVLFLTVLSVLLYLTNKRLWAPHKGKGKHA
jgi:ubiquinol-cytochrome c reductase cytochrome c1 subunit